jgi:hypothetical protein
MSNPGGDNSGRGRGNANKYKGEYQGKRGATPATNPQPARRVGACDKLGGHVFDYGTKDSADLLTTSWDALTIHAGTNYNEDIKMELENCTETIIPEPQFSEELTKAHEEKWEQQKTRLEQILRAKEQAETVARAKLIAATEYCWKKLLHGGWCATISLGVLSIQD